MPVSQEQFRQALSRFASGVTVVTVASGDELHGMTASAFASVSLDPPRVLVCLDKGSRTRALLTDEETFAISILSADQEDVSRKFADTGPKPFGDLTHKRGENGAPLLDGAIAWIECSVSKIIDGGDHDIVVGEVTACTPSDGAPLLYFDRTYRSLSDEG